MSTDPDHDFDLYFAYIAGWVSAALTLAVFLAATGGW